MNAEQVFHLAVEISDPKERIAFLDQACQGDEALKSKVEALIRADEHTSKFLETPPADHKVTLDAVPLAEGPGTIIGPYKLLEKIGEGGMAVVYMAQQTQPLKRRIALKIIKLGMDTKEVIARFEAERQALALMDHPNIAKVLDAGATDTGRPYFVMELVRGVSITEYCDKSKLSTHERLELFIPVCNAIHHAHQKGIIHRDLKPSNIMVTLHDSQPVPKVIDFGIAKATNRQLTEKTVFTRYAQMIGTPEYMSPEQAEMSGLGIDIRTDIYSLGVVLYELLAGALPFDPDTLRSAGYGEIQRIIQEQEPPRPSTRISTLGKKAEEIAARRQTSVAGLTKRLHRELEWIPLKAMRKDRTRRYRSASEFGDDIQSYLVGTPLNAGPESTFYRFRKWVKRHRFSVAAGLMITITLATGLATSTVMYLRAQGALNALATLEANVRSDQVFSRTQRLNAEGQYEAALAEIKSLMAEKDLGPKAHLLMARILVQLGRWDDAQTRLTDLTIHESPEIAGAASYMLARITLGTDPDKAQVHKQRAEQMLPNTAEAYSLRALASSTPEETIDWLSKALNLDPAHYPSLKARALAFYGAKQHQKMLEDAAALVARRPRDWLGFSLRAIARRELGELAYALEDHERALRLCHQQMECADIHDQRRETYMRMRNYTAALQDAQQCVFLQPKELIHRFHVFTALFWSGDYQRAQDQYFVTMRNLKDSYDPFLYKHVFDTLGSGSNLPLPPDIAHRTPFHIMQEAAEHFKILSRKGRCLFPAGIWSCCWSPDGRQIAFHRSPSSYSANQELRQAINDIPALGGDIGIEIIDITSGKKRLLTTFGHAPSWSPDGEFIAFCDKSYGKGDVWIIPALGGQPRKVAKGYNPCWAPDSRTLHYRAMPERSICCIRVDQSNAKPMQVMEKPDRYPSTFSVSPDGKYLAHEYAREVSIVELASHAVVAQWQAPMPIYGWRLNWSHDSEALFIMSCSWFSHAGTWILDIKKNEARRVFPAQIRIMPSSDGSNVLIGMDDEVWLANLDQQTSIHQLFGPGLSVDQFISQELQRWTRYIEANPTNADLYLERALTHVAMRDYERANEDLRVFMTLITPDDHKWYFKMCWWSFRYMAVGLYEESELLALQAAEILARHPSLYQSPSLFWYHPARVLVRTYEAWGKPNLAEKWRAEVPEEDGER